MFRKYENVDGGRETKTMPRRRAILYVRKNASKIWNQMTVRETALLLIEWRQEKSRLLALIRAHSIVEGPLKLLRRNRNRTAPAPTRRRVAHIPSGGEALIPPLQGRCPNLLIHPRLETHRAALLWRRIRR